ncbi:MAG TPA: hypothetical protein DCS09_13300 [Porphyromonadaceae bacterium]|nr:hypothetical protein [Porphyromonadaceae bacterium]
MKAEAIKHTGLEEAHACIKSTMAGETVLKSTLREIYNWEHSITRSQIFSIQLTDVLSFVSTHLVRHVTTVPFVMSKREDRGGTGEENRYTLVNHRFIANAEALLNMARRRLCYQASPETREAMIAIKEAVRLVDPDLAYYMVSNCIYRGMICPEPKPCGNYRVRRFMGEDDEISAMMIGAGR